MSDHDPSLIPGMDAAADDETLAMPTENTLSCLCGHDPHHGPCRARGCKCEDYRPVGFADLALDPNDPAVAAMKRLYELEHVPERVVEDAKAALEHVRQLEEEGRAMSASVDPTDPSLKLPPAEEQHLPGTEPTAYERAMQRLREPLSGEHLIVDAELTAMQRIVTALDRLPDQRARERVIGWAWARWGDGQYEE